MNSTIQDCTFTGVHWDASATEVVVIIAKGLRDNARAFDKLIDVLKASNVQIETMVKLGGELK